MTGMKSDTDSIHNECRELGSLVQALEAQAVKRRLAADDAAKRAATADLERTARAITAAIERVSLLAAHRDPTRVGIPDPVTDLDQDPQD